MESLKIFFQQKGVIKVALTEPHELQETAHAKSYRVDIPTKWLFLFD